MINDYIVRPMVMDAGSYLTRGSTMWWVNSTTRGLIELGTVWMASVTVPICASLKRETTHEFPLLCR